MYVHIEWIRCQIPVSTIQFVSFLPILIHLTFPCSVCAAYGSRECSVSWFHMHCTKRLFNSSSHAHSHSLMNRHVYNCTSIIHNT